MISDEKKPSACMVNDSSNAASAVISLARTPGQHRIVRFTWVRIVVGVLLLGIVSCEAIVSLTEALPGLLLPRHALMALLLRESQPFVAIWLLTGLYKRQAWLTAVAVLLVITFIETAAPSMVALPGRLLSPILHAVCLAALLAVRRGAFQAQRVEKNPLRLALACAALLVVGVPVGFAPYGPAWLAIPGTGSQDTESRSAATLEDGRLVTANTIIDFGVVSREEARVLRKELRLTNVGPGAIKIRGAFTKCGCMHATLDRQVVLPDQSVILRVQADWSDRTGAREERVIVATNQTAESPITIVVRGRVTAPAILDPPVVVITAQEATRGNTVYVQISQDKSTTRPFRVLDVSCPQEKVLVRRVDMGGHELPFQGGPGRFALEMKPLSTTNTSHIPVTFRTDIEGQPDLRLQVVVQGTRQLAAQPSALFFHLEPGDTEVRWQTVSVTVTDEGAAGQCQIRLEEASHRGLILEPARRTGPNAWQCRVGVAPGQCGASGGRGVLSVKCGSGALTIPVLALVRGAE